MIYKKAILTAKTPRAPRKAKPFVGTPRPVLDLVLLGALGVLAVQVFFQK
jgi:hypothetical protein